MAPRSIPTTIAVGDELPQQRAALRLPDSVRPGARGVRHVVALGDTRGAIAALIVAASALIVPGVRDGDPKLRRRYWLAFGLLAGAMVLLGLPIGIVAGSLVVLFAVQVLLNAVVARRVGRITLERLDQPAVMAGAERSSSSSPLKVSASAAVIAFIRAEGPSS